MIFLYRGQLPDCGLTPTANTNAAQRAREMAERGAFFVQRKRKNHPPGRPRNTPKTDRGFGSRAQDLQ